MSSNFGLLSDLRFTEHRVPLGFPESGDRVTEIHSALRQSGLAKQSLILPPRIATDGEITGAHTPQYLQRLKSTDWSTATFFDSEEVPASPRTLDTALLAAGSVVGAIDSVMAGEIRTAFCSVRPPGHHATEDEASGFCLLNNVAIGARHLLHKYGLERVLILDWDVHHGNGTQQIVEADPKVMFCSLHGDPSSVYPMTGFRHERGVGGGHVLNVPLMPGTSDAEYRSAFEKIVVPALRKYEPQFVLVSAGFDAHKDDPMEVLKLNTDTYAWMTHELVQVANDFAKGRLVSVLEGGYNLKALAESVVAHVQVLADSSRSAPR